ncbi:hypothetical protein C4D60_Mb01t08090 [Musa balbisiana]|uniref:FAD-binding PCMH-type domain-containing protein n=1 Tax=Musa balbisiana TaxID=52838 RepID=A0A4S8JKZ2_MUSBA|nr:hypothetical protein C4D60_Mb01t08090 [Musa balbisiana]
MALPTSFSLAILSILLAANSTIGSLNATHESFMRCFLDHTRSSNSSAQLLYSPNTTAYDAVFRSSIRNIRFLNSSSTTKPVLIVSATNESHVQAAVVCSRKHGLRVRVRSGGHDYEGMSYVSEGDRFIIVDLAALRSVTVDAEHGTAWVQAGDRFIIVDLAALRAVTVDAEHGTAWVQAGATLGEVDPDNFFGNEQSIPPIKSL